MKPVIVHGDGIGVLIQHLSRVLANSNRRGGSDISPVAALIPDSAEQIRPLSASDALTPVFFA